MLPLRGEETRLNYDLPGVGKKDEVFYYLRHEGDMVVVTKTPNTPPEIMIPDAAARWEPGDNDEEEW